jgi:polysaccharide biosynthesis protein PslE
MRTEEIDYAGQMHAPPSISGKQAPRIADHIISLTKNKATILVVFLTFVSSAAAAIWWMPWIYEAQSSVLVRLGREFIYRPEVGQGASSMSVDREAMMRSEIEILRNPSLARGVVEAIGPEHLYPGAGQSLISPRVSPLQAAAQAFANDVRVDQPKDTTVITVAYRHPDPKLAAEAVNRLISLLADRHLALLTDSRTGFYVEQANQLKRSLDAAQMALADFKREHRVSSLDEERSLLLHERATVDSDRRNINNRVAELNSRHDVLQQQLKTTPPTIPLYAETEGRRYTDDAKSQLLTLRIEEKRLLTQFGEKHPSVANVKEQIAMAEKEASKAGPETSTRTRMGRNTVYDAIGSDYVRTVADLGEAVAHETLLAHQSEEIESKIAALDAVETKLRELMRFVDLVEQDYRGALVKLQEARAYDSLDREKVTSLRVIQTAIVPERPVSPNVRLTAALAVVLGLGAGTAVALIRERLRDTVSTPDALERRLGIPVIAKIPYLSPRELT